MSKSYKTSKKGERNNSSVSNFNIHEDYRITEVMELNTYGHNEL
jgi:hypothetical protein